MTYFKTLLLFGLLNCLVSCSSGQEEERENSQEMQKETIAEEIATEFDRSVYDEIISELKGIEKHYVKDDLFRLLSLLEYKSDGHALRLKAELEKMGEPERSETIMTLDNSNGYLMHNYGAQADVEMTYWNLSNGNQLISETFIYRSNSPEDISFELYDAKEKQYKSLKIREVIPQYEELETMASSMDPSMGVDGGCIFTLPRNGINISFCADDQCIDLIWQDGTFILNE